MQYLYPRSFQLNFWQCPCASRYESSFTIISFVQILFSIDVEGCGGSLFVEDAVVIDAPLSANCKWKIQTDEKHVLVFTVIHNGNFKQVEEFLSVRILTE
jgi:hypothetical protein